MKYINVENATVRVHVRSTGTPVGDSLPYENGIYFKEGLLQGKYYLKIEAPQMGTVIRDFDLPKDISEDDLTETINNLIKEIEIIMSPGIAEAFLLVRDKDSVNISNEVVVKLAKILSSEVTGDPLKHKIENVPVETVLVEIIPDDPSVDTLQHYIGYTDIEEGYDEIITLYPEFSIEFRPKDGDINGNTIKVDKLYVKRPFEEEYTEVNRDSRNQYLLPNQFNGTIHIRAEKNGYVTAEETREVFESDGKTVTIGVVLESEESLIRTQR